MPPIENQNITVSNGIVTIVPTTVQVDVATYSAELDARTALLNSNLLSIQSVLANAETQIVAIQASIADVAAQKAKLG